MKGLIFNLLADLARQSGCEDDAWQIALAVSEEVTEELCLEAEDLAMAEFFSAATLQGGADFTFRWLLRSASPYSDDDWCDLGDASSALGPASEAPEALLEAMSRRDPRRK